MKLYRYSDRHVINKLKYHESYGLRGGHWGYKNEMDQIVISPKYAFATEFLKYGVAWVCKGNWEMDSDGRYYVDEPRWGVIDQKGNELTAFNYEFYEEVICSARFIFCYNIDKKSYVLFDIQTLKELCDVDLPEAGSGFSYESTLLVDSGYITVNYCGKSIEDECCDIFSPRENRFIYKKVKTEDFYIGNDEYLVVIDGDNKIQLPYLKEYSVETEFQEIMNQPVTVSSAIQNMTLQEYKKRVEECLRATLSDSGAKALMKEYEDDFQQCWEDSLSPEAMCAGMVTYLL